MLVPSFSTIYIRWLQTRKIKSQKSCVAVLSLPLPNILWILVFARTPSIESRVRCFSPQKCSRIQAYVKGKRTKALLLHLQEMKLLEHHPQDHKKKEIEKEPPTSKEEEHLASPLAPTLVALKELKKLKEKVEAILSGQYLI